MHPSGDSRTSIALGEETSHAQTCDRSFSLLRASCSVHMAAAQGLTGALIGTVKDAQGGVLRVRSSV